MSAFDEVDAYIAALEDSSGIVELIADRYNVPRCYIDDCREVATYVVHSYPDMVRLCDDHRSLHPVEIGETLCTGCSCRICGAS